MSCPRCGKAVYFGEEAKALGKKWHKTCMNCAQCNKKLDSFNINEHEGDIYCRGCSNRLFGTSPVVNNSSSLYTNGSTGNATSPPVKMNIGGGDRCPRCGKAVYHAEKVVANGNSWHKLCLTCAKCKKLLDSTTLTEREGEAYCKNCHGKLFGPKGYGYGGGAGTLSMDTGERTYEPTRSNVPATAEAYNAPRRLSTGQPPSSGRLQFGGADKCPRCAQSVYAAEKMIGAGSSWHKSCFNCATCRKKLDSSTLSDKDREIYCKACYGKQFGPKGIGYGIGAGTLQT